MEGLPVAEPQVVQATQKEYLKLQREDNKEARDARFRWLPLLSCPFISITNVSCPALLPTKAYLLEQLRHGCRFVWALAHSQDRAHNDRGLQLATSMLEDKEQEPQQTRDLLYLSALCQYRLGNYMTARSQIQELLKVSCLSKALPQAQGERQPQVGCTVHGPFLPLSWLLKAGC